MAGYGEAFQNAEAKYQARVEESTRVAWERREPDGEVGLRPDTFERLQQTKGFLERREQPLACDRVNGSYGKLPG